MRSIIIIGTFSLIVLSCSSSSGPETSMGESPDNPSAAPDFSLESLDGGNINLKDFKGKVVYIFFIGYSCPPCIASAPVTEQIYQKYKDEDVQVIAIDVWDGGTADVSAFRDNTGVTYPIGMNGSSIGSSYGVSNDFSVVIDNEGYLVYKAAGVNQHDLESFIDDLLM